MILKYVCWTVSMLLLLAPTIGPAAFGQKMTYEQAKRAIPNRPLPSFWAPT